MRKFLLITCLLTASLHGVGQGLELGAGVTAATVDFRIEDDFVHLSRPEGFTFYPTQQGLGLNLFASYGTCWCECLPLGYQLDLYLLSSEAPYRYHWHDDHNSDQRCRTLVDLTVKPGLLVTECVLLEAKFGLSFAHFRQHSLQKNLGTGVHLGCATDSRTRLGYVLGVATRVQVGACLTAFVAFDWRAFSGNLATTAVDTRPTDNYAIRSRLTRAYARTFTLGLAWSI